MYQISIIITLFLTLQSNFGIQPCTFLLLTIRCWNFAMQVLQSKRGIQLSRPLLSSFYGGTHSYRLSYGSTNSLFFFFFFLPLYALHLHLIVIMSVLTNPTIRHILRLPLYYTSVRYSLFDCTVQSILVYGKVYSIVNKLIIITQIVGIRYWGVINT